MKNLLSNRLIKEYIQSEWSFSNDVLYNLCRENFWHKDNEKILAKVLLIGRTYAAAIERRKKKEEINDDFYIETVAPEIKSSDLDKFLKELSQFDKVNEENLLKVLEAHKYFTDLTVKITGLNKRSFCSKYLHFHLPNLFFMYDNRVVGSLRPFIPKTPKKFEKIIKSNNVDNEYAKFVCKSFTAKENIQQEFGIELTIRQFDNILINLANKELKTGYKKS